MTEPTAPPAHVYSTVGRRTATFSWDPIECIERNGVITGYVMMFRWKEDENDGQLFTRDREDRNFDTAGLIPGTTYSFQVAGVNDINTGPFATTLITTNEESMNLLILPIGCNALLVRLI